MRPMGFFHSGSLKAYFVIRQSHTIKEKPFSGLLIEGYTKTREQLTLIKH